VGAEAVALDVCLLLSLRCVFAWPVSGSGILASAHFAFDGDVKALGRGGVLEGREDGRILSLWCLYDACMFALMPHFRDGLTFGLKPINDTSNAEQRR
jgi:hypothetical protein